MWTRSNNGAQLHEVAFLHAVHCLAEEPAVTSLRLSLYTRELLFADGARTTKAQNAHDPVVEPQDEGKDGQADGYKWVWVADVFERAGGHPLW